MHPEVEVLEFLGRMGFAHVPRLGGHLKLEGAAGPSSMVAIVQEFVANQGDCWTLALRGLHDLLAGQTESADVSGFAELGVVTGELHVALASDGNDPEFAPRALGTADADRIVSQVSARLTALALTLDHAQSRHGDEPRKRVAAVLAQSNALVSAMRAAGARAVLMGRENPNAQGTTISDRFSRRRIATRGDRLRGRAHQDARAPSREGIGSFRSNT